MTKKEVAVITIILLIFSLIGGLFTFNIFSNLSVKNFVIDSVSSKKNIEINNDYNCTDKEKIRIDIPQNKQLEKFNNYQEICNSYFANTMMTFIGMPINEEDVELLVKDIVQKLKDFDSHGIKPIVIVEPYSPTTGLINFVEYSRGTYQDVTLKFFERLKEEEVNDKMMGKWAPFPEINTPIWENYESEPVNFALNVNLFLGSMKNVFPDAIGTILLNATSFENDDLDWNNGDYVNFVPYLQNIDNDLVDSFGIQGFPWNSKANSGNKNKIFDAGEFLQPNIAIAAAKELKTRDIWVNTGVYNSKYTGDTEELVSLSDIEIRSLLDSIYTTLIAMQNYQENGYRITVNMFLEDKSNTNERTDWSLDDQYQKKLFAEFAKKLHVSNIDISIFDQ